MNAKVCPLVKRNAKILIIRGPLPEPYKDIQKQCILCCGKAGINTTSCDTDVETRTRDYKILN